MVYQNHEIIAMFTINCIKLIKIRNNDTTGLLATKSVKPLTLTQPTQTLDMARGLTSWFMKMQSAHVDYKIFIYYQEIILHIYFQECNCHIIVKSIVNMNGYYNSTLIAIIYFYHTKTVFQPDIFIQLVMNKWCYLLPLTTCYIGDRQEGKNVTNCIVFVSFSCFVSNREEGGGCRLRNCLKTSQFISMDNQTACVN